LDLWSVSGAIEVLRYAQGIKDGKPEGRLVLNKVEEGTTLSRELKAAAPTLGLDVASSVIRHLQVYRDAVQHGTVVSRLARKGRDAASDMDALFNELFEAEIQRLSVTRRQKVENA
jgi:chromosome partitioning protein